LSENFLEFTMIYDSVSEGLDGGRAEQDTRDVSEMERDIVHKQRQAGSSQHRSSDKADKDL